MTQELALKILKTGANVFLTGEPGAGKSHTINSYVAYLRERKVPVAITASTGIAATHISGRTIHSWAGIGILPVLSEKDLTNIAGKKHVITRIRDPKVLIIDEVSMLTPETIDMVDAVCRVVRENPEPFGGLQVIFVGDFFQMPPIARKDVEVDKNDQIDMFEDERVKRFSYNSSAWKRAEPIVCYLTEQHRQDDDSYSALLGAIRTNLFRDVHLGHITARIIKEHEAPEDIPKLYTHNVDVDRLNKKMLAKLPGKSHSFEMKETGADQIVLGLKKGCLSPESLELKEGAVVMFTKNNPKEGFVNGTLGVINGFDRITGWPIVKTKSGQIIEVEPMDWVVEENGKIKGSINQFPLRLAWAITVHKSQGMTLDEAVMDLRRVFEYGQGYVALSRVRRLSGLHIFGWNKLALEVHPEILAQDESFHIASHEAEEEYSKLSDEEFAGLHANFINLSGGIVPVEKSEKKKKSQTTPAYRQAGAQQKERSSHRMSTTSTFISKTDYILYRDCPKNTWYKIHKPEIYYADNLSDFEKHIIETGNEVELVARQTFDDGVLIEGRDEAAQKLTQELLAQKKTTLFQPVFVKDNFMAAVDVLKYDPDTDSYRIYEIKASNETDKKRHYYDLAFQVVLLRKCGLKVDEMKIMHLNSEYVRDGEVDIFKLFTSDEVTAEINELCEEVSQEMDEALDYLSAGDEPDGSCCCIYKGRSSHCTTFNHSNPHVPKYSIHDISRIGASKKKLAELVDMNVFHLHEVPEDMELSAVQRNQVNAYIKDEILMNKGAIAEELENLVYPLYFIDYETFPSAIPMFDGFSPYQQIPFQYSLYVLESPIRQAQGKQSGELRQYEFLHDKNSDPSRAFAESMRENIGGKGTVIVWSKKFECSRNSEIAERLPEFKGFYDDINARTYDLMDIFAKQHYVHKDFKGSASIKKVLPVLAPELSYKNLVIQEGGTASSSWLKLIDDDLSAAEKSKLKKDMLEYSKLDAFAMVRIFQELGKIIK